MIQMHLIKIAITGCLLNRTRVFVSIEAINTKMTFSSKNPNFVIAPMVTKSRKGYIPE